MAMFYVSEPGGTICPVGVVEWGAWFERTSDIPFDDGGRVVARDELPGGVTVSTVFLGLNHRLTGGNPPLIFETMIFGGEHDDYQERYPTAEAARQGHQEAVALATA